MARWSYYGEWLPNTYYAKSSQGRGVALRDGTRYVGTWLLDPGAALSVAAGLGLIVLRHRFLRRPALALAPALMLTIVLVTWWEGGDWMPSYRFLVPALPLLAAFAGAALARVVATSGPARQVAVVAVCAALIAAPWLARRNLETTVSWAGPGNPAGLAPGDYLRLGRRARSHIPGESTIAIAEAGIIPYVSGHLYIDIFGLNDKTIARLPGHWSLKAPTGYVLARDPDYVILAGDTGAPPPGRFAYIYANALFGDEAFRARYREVHRDGGFAVFCRASGEAPARPCRMPLENSSPGATEERGRSPREERTAIRSLPAPRPSATWRYADNGGGDAATAACDALPAARRDPAGATKR